MVPVDQLWWLGPGLGSGKPGVVATTTGGQWTLSLVASGYTLHSN